VTNLIINLDTTIFYWLYGFAGRSAFGDSIIVFFGEYLSYIILFVFVCFALRSYLMGGLSRMQPYLYAIFASIMSNVLVVGPVRFFVERSRPFITHNLPHLLENTSNSFPSGHTITIFSLATATYFFNKKLSYFLFISGLLIGMGRVMGAVHYPSDILGGIILGVITGTLIYKFCVKVFK